MARDQFCHFCETRHSTQCVRTGKFEISEISKLNQRPEIDECNLLLMHRAILFWEWELRRWQFWKHFFPLRAEETWVLIKAQPLYAIFRDFITWHTLEQVAIWTNGLNVPYFIGLLFAWMWYITLCIAVFQGAFVFKASVCSSCKNVSVLFWGKLHVSNGPVLSA